MELPNKLSSPRSSLYNGVYQFGGGENATISENPPSTIIIDFLGVLFFGENVANCQTEEWVPFKVGDWVPKIDFLAFPCQIWV